MPAAAFIPTLVADEMQGLAGGKGDQQPPQAVAVGQGGEAAGLGGAAEAVEGAEGDVLFVGGAAGLALELPAGQVDQPYEIALPQRLGGGGIAGLQLADPVGDRAIG